MAAVTAVALTFAAEARAAPWQGGGCAESISWKSNARDLQLTHASPIGTYTDMPICEPVALLADAFHLVHLDLTCDGCGDTANRFIEMSTNIKYRFVVRDFGDLTTLANDQASKKQVLEQRAVLYHPPDNIIPGETRTFHVDVFASSRDVMEAPPKPPDFALQGTFTISVTRKIKDETITLRSGQRARRIRDLHDITIQAIGDRSSDDPGNEDVATECWPNWTWKIGQPIIGAAWMGEEASPITSLNERDIVTLNADAIDVDELELRCERLRECAPSQSKEFLPDTLDYYWTANAGTFVGGQRGRTVVYKAPDQPNTQVQISVTIRDMGGQYPDAAIQVDDIAFTVGENRKTLKAGLISTIHAPHTPPPLANARPPMGGATWTPMPEAYINNYARFNGTTGQWEMGAKFMYIGPMLTLMPVHPWWKPTLDVQRSANPIPPVTFGNVAAIKAWTKNKQYRHVHSMRCVSILRRDVVHEILVIDLQNAANDMTEFMDVGWTPTAFTTPAAKAAALAFLGRLMKDFELGEFSPGGRTVWIRDEFKSVATVSLEDWFRVGKAMNDLQLKLTNRRVPWQRAELKTLIPAMRPFRATDASGIGNFPTHWPYIDTGTGVLLQGTPTVPIPYVQFLDRDGKVDPKGI